ncbi:GDYXXLXY domain-containing protein [Flavobacterium psychrotrophum]|uniref:GDYXXLXY domain-containing protein n=1 Tax=Flavobacterium psychrotrophum TaxID=2294119 RepID=UPI000E30F059|nr:GDYXXLXY domain-containing protein [Flavobacterium psychrotrophum]
MKTKHILIAFAATAMAQLIIPAQMVFENEMAYTSGTEYKFKTEPVDPNDPFRGKYINLNFDADEVTMPGDEWNYKEKSYVVLGKDRQGFAKIDTLLHDKPAKGDYVQVEANYTYDGKVRITYPFNRFYMEESKAYDAETAYREYSRDTTKVPAYAIVSVRKNVAVVKDVIINGQSIQDYVAKGQK